MDNDSEFPETASILIELRSPLTNPVHKGDQSVLFRTITL